MRIAIVGSGRVGQALGRCWADTGHEVVFGVRDPEDPKHSGLGDRAAPAEAVSGADAVLVALPWTATGWAAPAW